eukprot:jgi/Psemu1/300173/fgenesh1_kg.7_\
MEKYDIVIGMWTPSSDRMNLGVSFVNGHSDGSIIMIRNEQTAEAGINWVNFLQPFEPGVWCVIIAVIMISAFAYQLIEGIGGKGRLYHQKSRRVWLMENMYLSFINFTGNHNYEPQTLGGMMFAFSFGFWAMLITAAYTANLASILVQKRIPDSRLQDIQDAIDQGVSVCIQSGSLMDEYVRENYPQIIPNLVPIPFTDTFSAINRGECDVLITQSHQFRTALEKKETNPTCTLNWEGRVIKTVKDAFVTKLDPALLCTDLVNEVFNFYLKEMEDSGVLEAKWDEHFAFFGTEGHCEESRDQNDAGDTEKGVEGALSLDDMAGTMLFQLVGAVGAILVAIVSGFDPKTRLNRMTNHGSSTDHSSSGSRSDLKITSDKLESGGTDLSAVKQQLQVLTKQIDAMKEMLEQMQGNHAERRFSNTSFQQEKSAGSDAKVAMVNKIENEVPKQEQKQEQEQEQEQEKQKQKASNPTFRERKIVQSDGNVEKLPRNS